MNLVLALALLGSVLGGEGHTQDYQELKPEWVFMAEVGAWQEPPSQLNKDYLEGDADILILFPSGDFFRIFATAFRLKENGAIEICNGCGFAARSGTWKPDKDGDLLVTDFWIQHVPGTGDPLEEESHYIFVETDDNGSMSRLEFDSKVFRPLQDYPGNLEVLGGCLLYATHDLRMQERLGDEPNPEVRGEVLGEQVATFEDMRKTAETLQDVVDHKGDVKRNEAESIGRLRNDGRDRWGMPIVFVAKKEPAFSFLIVSYGSDQRLDVDNIEDYFSMEPRDIVGQPDRDIVFRDGVAITRVSPRE